MMMVKREARQGQRLARHSPLTGNSAIRDCGCKVQNENWLKVSTFFWFVASTLNHEFFNNNSRLQSHSHSHGSESESKSESG